MRSPLSEELKMSINDKMYFSQRALEERERAEAAPSRNIAKVHLSLATKYEALAAQSDEIIALDDERAESNSQGANQGASESSPQSLH